MTELERARQHLSEAQRKLYQARRSGWRDLGSFWEGIVLAALSWAWEAQLREWGNMEWRCRDGQRLAIKDMGTSHIKCCIALIEQSNMWMGVIPHGKQWRGHYLAPMKAELERRGNP